MEVYRIALASFSTLTASGMQGRWNSAGYEIIYTAESRSLACLELVVHTSPIALTDNFKIMVIDVPDKSVQKIDENDLSKGWHLTDSAAYDICRGIGDEWAAGNKSLVLQVPSAIIKNECNCLINVRHPDFIKAKLNHTEPFFFDPRIKK